MREKEELTIRAVNNGWAVFISCFDSVSHGYEFNGEEYSFQDPAVLLDFIAEHLRAKERKES